MLLTQGSLNSYPVFPDWVFEGSVTLDDNLGNKLIAGMHKINKTKTDYGWISEKNSLTQSLQRFRQIVGTMFFDHAISQFRLPEKARNIESVDAQVYCIKPGMFTPTIVNRKRWYQSAVFLSSHPDSCNIEMSLFGEKQQVIPKMVMDDIHIIQSEKFKAVFWPAYIPWKFTVNNTSENVLVFTNSFLHANYHR